MLGRNSVWPRRFLAFAARACGIDMRSEGLALPRHVLFVANHTSWLDILVLAGTSGTTFVSKEEVARWPVIGWLASLNNTIYVARAARGEVRAQADALGAALVRGQPVALFPEGTTNGGAEILPFRAALFAAITPPPPGIRVQPVLIDYGSATDEIAWLSEETAPANVLRVLGRRGRITATLRFLAPLDPAAYPDRKAIAAAARQAILAELGSIPLGEVGGDPL